MAIQFNQEVKDTNKPSAKPNLFGLFFGIGKGQACLAFADSKEQSQAILLGFAETEYLQRSASVAKGTKSRHLFGFLKENQYICGFIL